MHPTALHCRPTSKEKRTGRKGRREGCERRVRWENGEEKEGRERKVGEGRREGDPVCIIKFSLE